LIKTIQRGQGRSGLKFMNGSCYAWHDQFKQLAI